MAVRVSTTPIIALDVPNAEDALEMVEYFGDLCRFYKVGNELFTASGPAIVQALRARGCDVFLDLKFHDIPNTVAGGVRNAAAMGARLVTVHASGGRAMLDAAVNAAGPNCGVVAVTILTSLDAGEIGEAWGRTNVDVSAEVMRLAAVSADAGCHGIVCSGQEAGKIRDRFGDRLATLVPGIRAAAGATDDQARVVTPEGVAAAGARYAVVGRMVTAAKDRRAAMERVRAALA